jgi:2-polyprenyl-3-methyl-5-hydroxy-6-metoxy-1,4-benzoquinol methylase
MRYFLFILLCLAVIAAAQPSIPDDAVWKDFTSWLQRQPPNSKPGELIQSYHDNLLRQGVPAEETGRRMRVISNFIFTRRRGVELLWDKVFAGKDPIFLQTPSAIVMSAIQGRKPGKALDVGMGQGRNSVYLATQGWDVTGFDPSAEGVRIARTHADRAGVRLLAIVARDDEFDYGADAWDLVVVTYVRDLNQADADRFWTALKPGGMVVYENGADESNALLKAFLRFQIVRFEDIETNPEWNPQNHIRVQRLIAQKTADVAKP